MKFEFVCPLIITIYDDEHNRLYEKYFSYKKQPIKSIFNLIEEKAKELFEIFPKAYHIQLSLDDPEEDCVFANIYRK
jgi:hypothetical protein